MRRLLVLALAVGVSVAASAPPALLDPASDRIVRHEAVPDPVRKVGEVRLVQRGDAVVVQTVLVTKALARVVAEIRKKEERNWPEGADGRADMLRYVAALDAARGELGARREATDDDDRRQRLLIEFAASPDAVAMELATFADGDVDGPQLPGRTSLARLDLSRAYVVRNMRLIVADAFDLDAADADRLVPLAP